MKIFDVRAYSQAYKDYATSSNMELPNANIVIVLERLPIKCRSEFAFALVCFTVLYDWWANFAPFCQPMRCQTNTNRDLLARVFPRLAPDVFSESLIGSLHCL